MLSTWVLNIFPYFVYFDLLVLVFFSPMLYLLIPSLLLMLGKYVMLCLVLWMPVNGYLLMNLKIFAISNKFFFNEAEGSLTGSASRTCNS